MFKRSLAIAAVTFVALGAPAAAFASTDYPAPPPGITCSTAQAAPGATFTCTVTGDPAANATLTTTFDGADAAIAGTVTSAPRLVGANGAVFTITAPSVEGSIGISAVVGQQPAGSATVTVADQLSGTGFSGMPLAIGAGVLLIAGAGVIVLSARKRERESASV